MLADEAFSRQLVVRPLLGRPHASLEPSKVNLLDSSLRQISAFCSQGRGLVVRPLSTVCQGAVPNDSLANRNFVMRVKSCMVDEGFDGYLI